MAAKPVEVLPLPTQMHLLDFATSPSDLTLMLSLSLNNVQPGPRHAISNCYWLGNSNKSFPYDIAPPLLCQNLINPCSSY